MLNTHFIRNSWPPLSDHIPPYPRQIHSLKIPVAKILGQTPWNLHPADCAVMQTKGFLTAPSNCQSQARQAGDCSSSVQDVHSSHTHRLSTGFQTAFAPFVRLTSLFSNWVNGLKMLTVSWTWISTKVQYAAFRIDNYFLDAALCNAAQH